MFIFNISYYSLSYSLYRRLRRTYCFVLYAWNCTSARLSAVFHNRKIFYSFFPIANIAYRVNLMCSIFSSITVLLLYLFFLYLITLQFRNPHSKLATHIVAFSASLCFAFSRTFWSQSVDAEVYALNALFVVLIFYILIKSLSSSNNIYYYLLSFIYGLSLTNHQSMILFAPIFALVVILRVKNQSRFVKPMVLMLLLFFLVFLYIYFCLSDHLQALQLTGKSRYFRKFNVPCFKKTVRQYK